MVYKVTVLGTIGTEDKTFELDCEVIHYENECIVLKKKIDKTSGLVTLLSVPQNCSIVELKGV